MSKQADDASDETKFLTELTLSLQDNVASLRRIVEDLKQNLLTELEGDSIEVPCLKCTTPDEDSGVVH